MAQAHQEQAHQERLQADGLPAGSVVSVLLEQHAKIRDLFEQTAEARGEARQQAFDELRELLAVHEAGEELVVRPVTRGAADGRIAEERDHEGKEAAKELAELESRDISSRGFAESLAELESDISDHADAEERDEFPYLLSAVDQDTQMEMGARLLEVQRAAPTHPHPAAAGSTAAQAAVGPFAALLDRSRDAFREASEG